MGIGSKDEATRIAQILRDWHKGSRRDFLKWGGTAAVGAVFAPMALLEACGPSSSTSSSSTGTPVKGGSLVESVAQDPILNPMTGIGQAEVAIGNMFDGLLGWDPDGNLIPLLAQALPKLSADQSTYTFKLKQGIKWSDGQPLTADDVIFTYNLLFAPEYSAVLSSARGNLQKTMASITAPDPQTIIIQTAGVQAPFLNNHGRHYVLPKHVLGSLSPTQINTAPFFTTAGPTAVTGPFKFVEWIKGDHMTLTRNDTSYRGAPYLDQYVWRVTKDPNTQATQLQTGDVDVAKFSSWGLYQTLKASPVLDVDVFKGPTGTRFMYQMNPAQPAGKFFGDQAVRQALGYAIDYDGMSSAIYFKVGAIQATTQIPPISWGWNPNVKPKYSYNPKMAASMLDAAGWTVGSDGVRQKNGVEIAFTIITATESPEWTQSAEVMQQNFKAINVNATVKVIAYQQLLAIVSTTRNFDMAMYGILPPQGFPDPDLSLYFSSASAGVGGLNGGDYTSAAMDQLIKEASSTTVMSQRQSLSYQIQDLLNSDAPSLPLHYWNSMWVRNKKVQNFAYPGQYGPATVSGPRFGINKVWISH